MEEYNKDMHYIWHYSGSGSSYGGYNDSLQCSWQYMFNFEYVFPSL